MLMYFVALLLLLLTYVIVKFILSKVEPVSSLADILGLIAGILVALWYVYAI